MASWRFGSHAFDSKLDKRHLPKYGSRAGGNAIGIHKTMRSSLLILMASCLTMKAAISFNGTSFATVLDASSLGFTQGISLHFTALKRGNTTVNSYFIFGKGTSAYNYSASYITVGDPYSFESKWNTVSLFQRQYAQSATPGVATNNWVSIGCNLNHATATSIFFDRGAPDTLIPSAGADQIPTLTTGEPLEIGKGRGGFARWSGPIGEIAIWNTNLTSRQLQILSGSKMKGMARQIRPTNLVIHLTMDHFAAGASLDGTNIIRDYSGRGNHASPITTPLGYPEGYASYYPNE